MINKKLVLAVCVFLIIAMAVTGCRPAERPLPQETRPGVPEPAPAPGQMEEQRVPGETRDPMLPGPEDPNLRTPSPNRVAPPAEPVPPAAPAPAPVVR